jgi:hypothetical protein
MSSVKDRLLAMRGSAAAPSPRPASSRAQRFASAGRGDGAAPPLRAAPPEEDSEEDADAGGRETAPSAAPAPPQQQNAVPAQASRALRFGAGRSSTSGPACPSPGPTARRPAGPPVDSSGLALTRPSPGQITQYHLSLFEHCMKWAELGDTNYAKHSAALFERNEPWSLFGLFELVRHAVETGERPQDRAQGAPTEPTAIDAIAEAPTPDAASHSADPAAAKPQAEHRCTHEGQDGDWQPAASPAAQPPREVTSSRAQRYSRPRG